eukprot:SAG31_NODE_288_length_18400_cov_55.018851_18_plen_171_part_00
MASSKLLLFTLASVAAASEDLAAPRDVDGHAVNLIFENLCAACGSCDQSQALRLEERVGSNCANFVLSNSTVQVGTVSTTSKPSLCWATSDCSAGGGPLGLGNCSGKLSEFRFNRSSGRVESRRCVGMCAAKAGGPPASPAIVLDSCHARDATGWTAVASTHETVPFIPA